MRQFLTSVLCYLVIFLAVPANRAFTQACPDIEAMTPKILTFNGPGNPFLREGTYFPDLPGYWNRWYKLDETTGQLKSATCIYGGIIGDPESLDFYCACYLDGTYFRRVSPATCPVSEPCGDLSPIPQLPITDNNSSSSNWSASSTWVGNYHPDFATALAIVVTKSSQIDMDISFSKDHWVIFTGGISTISAGRKLTCNSTIQVYPGAQLENFGTINGTGQVFGNFTNSGTISPGNSPGNFTITGNYTATNSAVHQIEIASANQYDTISIASNPSLLSGNASLDGELDVSLLNGYTPVQTESYTILTAATLTGTFKKIVWPAGIIGTITYNTNSVVLSLSGSTLPLSLLSFSGMLQSNYNKINWQTTNEINTSHFIVQRSVNGTTFTNIGRVEATNTSGNNDYSLTDANPINGVNFYRLQMVDIDGKTAYSSIIKIVFTGKNELQVFPNPAKNTITLSGLQNKGTIKIIAADGKVVKQLTANGGSMLVDISSLAKGIYILQYINEAKTEQIKIIKQ